MALKKTAELKQKSANKSRAKQNSHMTISHRTFGSGSVMSELLVQYAGLDRASGGRVT